MPYILLAIAGALIPLIALATPNCRNHNGSAEWGFTDRRV
jgi:hypothetical protein